MDREFAWGAARAGVAVAWVAAAVIAVAVALGPAADEVIVRAHVVQDPQTGKPVTVYVATGGDGMGAWGSVTR